MNQLTEIALTTLVFFAAFAALAGASWRDQLTIASCATWGTLLGESVAGHDPLERELGAALGSMVGTVAGTLSCLFG